MTDKERFIDIYKRCIKREGAEELLEYLTGPQSDFFTAPASTRYHNSCRGGLVNHSLNVYDCLCDIHKVKIYSDEFFDILENYLTNAAKNGISGVIFRVPLFIHSGDFSCLGKVQLVRFSAVTQSVAALKSSGIVLFVHPLKIHPFEQIDDIFLDNSIFQLESFL